MGWRLRHTGWTIGGLFGAAALVALAGYVPENSGGYSLGEIALREAPHIAALAFAVLCLVAAAILAQRAWPMSWLGGRFTEKPTMSATSARSDSQAGNPSLSRPSARIR